jgi:glycine cleavage system T protein (aminomethyltransferase)
LPSELLRTPLHALPGKAGARMVDFAGWDMPVQYPTGILAEHIAVRTGCGIFDLSHMGRVYVRGADALGLAQECCTRDLSRIPAGEAAYSVLCDEDGGIVDDVIAYKLGDGEVLFVFNASNRVIDIEFFAAARDRLGLQADLVDRTLETALVGVQGPTAQPLLQPLCDTPLEPLAGYAFTRAEVCGAPALVARTGYTGEDGFEVMVDAEAAERVWQGLAESATPAGLGARDTLRTEAGFALYGHEIDRSTNPYEARLGWVVSLSKPSFVGRDALARIKAEGPKRRLVGLRVAAGGVPRPGVSILDSAGASIGQLTSGTFSPTLKQNVAMGYVPVELSHPASRLAVDVRGKAAAAEVVSLPFVPHHSRPRAKM